MLCLFRLGYHAEQEHNTTRDTPLQGSITEVKIKYAVNVVSLMYLGWQWLWKRGVGLPGMLFAPALRLIEMAREVGFDGVQMLPIRGSTGLEPNVLLFEDAWNAVWNPFQALRHGTGAAGLPSTIADWVVSPNPDICDKGVKTLEAQMIPRVYHKPGLVPKGSLVEVNPDTRCSATDYLYYARADGLRYIIDTYHLRRQPREPGWKSELLDKVGDWRPTVDALAPYVRVIHVNHTGDKNPYDLTLTFECAYYALKRAQEAGIEEMILVAEYDPLKASLPKIRTHAEARVKATEELARLKQIVSDAGV